MAPYVQRQARQTPQSWSSACRDHGGGSILSVGINARRRPILSQTSPSSWDHIGTVHSSSKLMGSTAFRLEVHYPSSPLQQGKSMVHNILEVRCDTYSSAPSNPKSNAERHAQPRRFQALQRQRYCLLSFGHSGSTSVMAIWLLAPAIQAARCCSVGHTSRHTADCNTLGSAHGTSTSHIAMSGYMRLYPSPSSYTR